MQIDEAINQVERLYQGLTGNLPPQNEKPYAPLLPEVDPAQQLSQQIDQLMMVLAGQTQTTPQATPFVPPLSIWESEKDLVIRVELAGVTKEEVDLSFRGNNLVISGQRRVLEHNNGHQLRNSDCHTSLFFREIPLSMNCKAGDLNAKMENGLLEITIAKLTPEDVNQSIRVG